MRCYQHRNLEAIGVCQACGKATCAECCDASGPAVVCSTECAVAQQQSRDLQQRLAQSYGIGGKPPLPISVPTYFLFGLILLATALFLSISRQQVDILTLAMAAIFFVMAAVNYKRHGDLCKDC